VCSGTTSPLLSATTLSGLASPASLIPGAIAVNAVQHLKVSVTLPDQAETTVNGALPAATVQNKSVSLTYTFAETQRSATTGNS
jgi:hypothetical protein